MVLISIYELALIVPSTTLPGVNYTTLTESASVFETQLSSSNFYAFTLCIILQTYVTHESLLFIILQLIPRVIVSLCLQLLHRYQR